MRCSVFCVVVGLLMSCGPDREIKKKATFACTHLLLSYESLDALPENVPIDEYLRDDDLRFLEKKRDEAGSGLAAAMVVAMRPATKALAQAKAAATNCIVGEVVRDGDSARIKVKEESPNLDLRLAGGLEKMGELAKIDSAEQRLSKAKELVSTAKEKLHLEHEVAFVKTANGWRINLGLPEKAKATELKKEREATADRAVEEAMNALKECDVALARSKTAEAKNLVPELAGIESVDEVIDAAAVDCIGGRWRRTMDKDAMTDDVNVTVVEYSDNEVEGRFSKRYRGLLVGRCNEKKLTLFVATEQMLDDTYDVGIIGRYRMGDQKAARVVLSRSTDYQAGFFSSPREWLKRLSDNESSVLTFELPIYSSAPVVLRFNLAGVDKAAAVLNEACPAK